jgi:very-long-chain (3R)-3-hydroxyacyl-CoA dehydratase
MSPVKAYLLAYNVLSCLLWAQVFILTIAYLVSPHPSAPTSQSFLSPLTRFFRADPTSQTPKLVQNAIDHLRGSYHFLGLGTLVKWTQTLAVLDVAHAATGLVKSNVGTAASQVFSRLWAVWAVVEMVPEVSTSVACSVSNGTDV